MGGAGFPTCVKLKPAKPVDTILINGCECEPLLTADHRVLLEYADDIIFGLKAVLKTTGAEKGIAVDGYRLSDNFMDNCIFIHIGSIPCKHYVGSFIPK